jgi:hypothetical protein
MGLFDLIAGAIVMKGVRDLLGGNSSSSSSSFNSGGWNSRYDDGYDHYCDCCDDFHDDFDCDMFF